MSALRLTAPDGTEFKLTPTTDGDAALVMAKPHCYRRTEYLRVTVAEFENAWFAWHSHRLCLVEFLTDHPAAQWSVNGERYQVWVDGVLFGTEATEADAVAECLHECRNCVGEDPPVSAHIVDTGTVPPRRSNDFFGFDGIATAPDVLWGVS